MFISSPKRYYSGMILLALSAVTWIGAMIVLLMYYPKYLPDGDLLLSSDFEGILKQGNRVCTKDFGCWNRSNNGVLITDNGGFGESTGVRLMSTGEQGSSLRWDLPNPERFDFLELKGKMRVEDIKGGKEPWDIARCLLYFRDIAGNSRWDYPHSAEGLSGSSPWVEFAKTFQVPGFAVSAHVLIHNDAKSGTMWIDDISLQPLRLNHQFFRYRNILLGVGAILALTFFFKLKIWEDFGWIILVVLVISVLGVLCPDIYMRQIAGILNIKVEMLKKTGHFIVFLAMGTLSSLWLQRRLFIRDSIGKSIYHAVCLFAVLALFAAVTELLQLFTIDRTPTLVDYLIDLSGILVGILLGFIITRRCRVGHSKPS